MLSYRYIYQQVIKLKGKTKMCYDDDYLEDDYLEDENLKDENLIDIIKIVFKYNDKEAIGFIEQYDCIGWVNCELIYEIKTIENIIPRRRKAIKRYEYRLEYFKSKTNSNDFKRSIEKLQKTIEDFKKDIETYTLELFKIKKTQYYIENKKRLEKLSTSSFCYGMI